MWESLRTRATDFTAGGRFRRRGAKLGILIAIMMTLPGLVAATDFVNVPSSSQPLTGAPTGTPGVDCGFNVGTSTDAYVTLVAGGTKNAAGNLFTTVTANVKTLEATSSTGYEYLEGELFYACYNTPSVTSISATITISGNGVSNLPTGGWTAVYVTKDTGSTTTDLAAIANWCNPTSQDYSSGCVSATPTACTFSGSSFNPSLYAAEGIFGTPGTGNSWIWYSVGSAGTSSTGAFAGAQTTPATTCGGSAAPTTSIVTGQTNTLYYYLDIGFAFGDVPASITSASWTITASETVTP